MFDLAVLVAGVLLAFRGWRRGLLRQMANLIPFLLGLLIAVRLTPDWASVVEDWLGIPYEAGLLVVGLVLVGTVTFGGAALLHALARMARLPGLNTVDRAAGAVVGVLWLILGLVALVWFASFLSLPSDVTALLSESSAVEFVAGPDSLPRGVLDALTRDGWQDLLIRVQELSGSVDDLLRNLLSGEAPAQS